MTVERSGLEAGASRLESHGLPALLVHMASRIDATAILVVRSNRQKVLVDAAWKGARWVARSSELGDIDADRLSVIYPVEAVRRGAEAVRMEQSMAWEAGRSGRGSLVLAVSGEDQSFSEGALDMLATAVEVLLERQLSDSLELRKEVLKERARIASQLHQGPSQELATVSVQLEILQALLERDPARGHELVSEIRASTRHAMTSLRAALLDLTPAVSDSTWLGEGLSRLIRNFGNDWGLDVDFAIEGEAERIVPDAVGLVFAFVTEGLTNLRKHSETRRGHVHVSVEKDRLLARVQGEGQTQKGIGPHDLPGHGLNIMWGRAHLLGGDLRVERVADNATEVVLELPS